jgi:hypothetical protein
MLVAAAGAGIVQGLLGQLTIAGKRLRLRYRWVSGTRRVKYMLWAGIAFGIGMVLIIGDYRMATAPDPTDKHKRRKKLNAVAAKQLRDMFMWTVVVTAAVYFVPDWF